MRTTEELLKDADDLAEHISTRRHGYSDIFSHHDCEKLIAELSAKLRETEVDVCKCEGGRGQYRIDGGAFRCWDCDKPTPPKKETEE